MTTKRAGKEGSSIWRGSLLPLIIGLVAVAEILMLLSRPTVKHAKCPPEVVCPKRRKLRPASPLKNGSAAVAAVAGPRPTLTDVPSTLAQATPGVESQADLPYFDIIAVLFAIASEHDLLRMDAAAETWLAWKDPAWSFHYMIILCTDDPGAGPVGCKPGKGCARGKKNVVVVPCKHGYKSIVTKSSEGFRYLASHFRFKYVLKADIDTMVDMRCIAKAIKDKAGRCSSFALGNWREAGTSHVFKKSDPGAGKYPNEPFIKDSGFKFYPPYMVGWLNVYSADVARFLGMAGLPSARMPKWKDGWTIDDAAIGTFLLGLDLCRLSNPCKVVTDVEYEQFAWRYNGDVTGHQLKFVPDVPVKGFKGPLRDDVPGTGDIENTWTETLEACADKCRRNPECHSFEHSPTAGRRAAVKNCQLATGTQLTGHPCEDFNLFLKDPEKVKPDGPVDGFEGPIADDVPGLGDLANVFTETLEDCAQKCRDMKPCRSFEHSPTYRKTVDIKNCQLNTGTQRAGIQYEDYSLYILSS